MFLKVILIFISLSFSNAKLDVVRMTQYGPVRGKILTSLANSTIKYLSFKGVQYAAPPLGRLRFKEPQPPQSWTTPKCAYKHKSYCMQFDPNNGIDLIGREDCLYLDVYIPITAASSFEKMPVMVWFHGGNWVSGNTNVTGPDYFMEKPVVIVQVEFRLNVFGFFTTLDDNAKGNAGLKDQVFALKWVRANIKNFNGDPSTVTIFGSCVGSIAVIFHMLSPLSKGIGQSGSPKNGWAMQRHHPLRNTNRLLRALEITSTDNAEIVEELQAIDAETLIRTALNFSVVGYYTPYDSQPFGAIIERKSNTSFLSEPAYDLLLKGKFTKVPLIVGCNSQEGERPYFFYETGRVDINIYQNNPRMLIPQSMNIPENSTCINRTLNNITRRYFPDRNYTNLYEWIPYMTMNIYMIGILDTLTLLQKEVPVYFYVLSYAGSRNIAFLRPPDVGHTGEMPYLWYPQGVGANPNETAADKLTRQRMVTLWTNFAAQRNPTPEPDELLENVIWPTSKFKQNYINVNSTIRIKNPIPYQSQMPFWVQQYGACGFPDPNPNNMTNPLSKK